MRVETYKPNRSSMQVGLRRQDFGFWDVRQKRVVHGVIAHLRVWAKNPLVTLRRAGRGSPRHS